MEEVFNFESVLNLLMNDEVATKDLLKNYLAQTTKHVAKLEALITDASFEEQRNEIKKEAHLLKGSSLNVSAKNFARTTLELENKAHSISQDEAVKLYSLILEQWQTLQKAIKKVLS